MVGHGKLPVGGTHHLQEVQQGLLVVLPQAVERFLWRELHTAQLHRDLKAVGV